MPRFDPETIAALAEGRLSPDEAARVEAAISADPDSLAELDLQRAAIELLGSATGLHLTESESSRLRSSVADALGLADTAVDVATAPRRVPWGSLGIAAAALLGLVAIVPVVGLLNTGGGDAADVALAPTATSSADRAEGAAESDSSAGTGTDTAAAITEDGSFDAGQEAPGDDLLGFASSTTLAARTTTTDTAAVDEQTTTTQLDDATAESQPPTTEGFEALVTDLIALYEDPDAVGSVAAEALEEDKCWMEDTESRGGTDPGDRWSFEFDDGDQTVVVFFRYDDEGTPGPFTIYEIDECTTVAEIPEAP